MSAVMEGGIAPSLPWSESSEQAWRFRFFLLLGCTSVGLLGSTIPLISLPERELPVYVAVSETVEVQWLPALEPLPLTPFVTPIEEPVPDKVEPPAPETPPTAERVPDPSQKTEMANEPAQKVAQAPKRTTPAGDAGARGATAIATARERARSRFDDIFGGGLSPQRSGQGARSVEREQLVSAASAVAAGGGVEAKAIAYSQRAAVSAPKPAAAGLQKSQGSEITSTLAESVKLERKKHTQAGQRSRASIQLVFDRNKRRFDQIYARALRQQAGLQGEVVFSLTIAATGKVSRVSLARSALGNAELEHKLLATVRQLDFGVQADVDSMTIQYPIQFYPS